MDQQTQTEQGQTVQWGPGKRTGQVLDTIPAAGQQWKVTRSDGWHERKDLPFRAYQRSKGPNTVPCDLIILADDLEPASPAEPGPAKVHSTGLREDAAEAVRLMREILACGLVGKQKDLGIALERTLSGIKAAVEQG